MFDKTEGKQTKGKQSEYQRYMFCDNNEFLFCSVLI